MGDLLLERPEAGLAARGEEVGDGGARAGLDLVVEVDEPADRDGRRPPLPTVVLPEPMNPASARCRPRAFSGAGCHRSADPREIGVAGGEHVDHRIASELLEGGARELERDRSLGDDRERLDRLHVGALDERLRRLGRLEVDRVERAHQRR